MKRYRNSSVAVLCLAGLSAALACVEAESTSSEDTTPALATIEVSPTSLTLATPGESSKLTAVARDTDGAIMSGVTLTWSSSNTAVATVSSAGVVTAHAFGPATIQAAAGDATSNLVSVTVGPPPQPSQYTCTQVIGYSQTNQWYSAGFESVVNDDRWQEVWWHGAAIDLWADPDYSGWSRPIESPCVSNSDTPDRVLMSISADFHDDPTWWADNITIVIGHIRDKYPSVQQIMLQPVVGGPNHQQCSPNGVRASQNHPVIDEGIALVVGGDVIAGFSPEVRTCDDYVDFIGHLSAEGSAAIAVTLGEYYSSK